MMQPGLALSVVVPVHDKGEVLERVLLAAIEQSLAVTQFEILVVDDHSRDGSAAVIDAVAARHPVVRRIARRAGPPGAALTRNSAIEAARGSWVLLLDADVVVHRDLCADCLAWGGDPRTVGLVPTVGSSTTNAIWPLLAPEAATRGDDALPIWRGVADARPPLDGLRAPWVFFWTTATLVSRALLMEVGGFDTGLDAKGSEDIELGYRLHAAGARFAFLTTAPVLHLPHRRDRAAEEATDRAHERHMLTRHRSFAMEMLCAFDAGHMHDALDQLYGLRPTDAYPDVWSGLPPHGQDFGRSIAFFAQEPAMVGWLGPTLALDHRRPAAEERIETFFGLALPFEDRTFDTAIVPDLRETVPEALLCRLLQEAGRVASTIVYVRIDDEGGRRAMLSERTLAMFDRPYWERSVPISRHLHDWRAEEIVTLPHRDGVTACTLVRVTDARARRATLQ